MLYDSHTFIYLCFTLSNIHIYSNLYLLIYPFVVSKSRREGACCFNCVVLFWLSTEILTCAQYILFSKSLFKNKLVYNQVRVGLADFKSCLD
jgi:hypothetical protein